MSLARLIAAVAGIGVVLAAEGQAQSEKPMPTVPEGFEIELVAGPPLVERPIMAGFDDRGRLFVCDSAGVNDTREKLLANPPHCVRMLEDTDGDGRFDKSTVFADKMTFPQGALWVDGGLLVASPPYIWRLEDTDGNGVCDKRTQWAGWFDLSAKGNDLHGPFEGPDRWLYFSKGGFVSHKYTDASGQERTGKASHIFRCRRDGSGMESVLGAGMDNPVEVAFTPEGELIFSCTFYTNPTGGLRDALIHGVEGGAYPKDHALVKELKRTGDLLPAMTHLGVAAAAGLTRYQSDVFGEGYRDNLFACLFNMHKVTRHVMERHGSTFRTRNEDFVVSADEDFHPTDVLEDADGSLLVLDTGGWFRIACPTSRIAKPQVTGGIYRVKRKGAKKVEDPWGLRIEWEKLSLGELVTLLADPRPAVADRAMSRIGAMSPRVVTPLLAAAAYFDAPANARRNALWALARTDAPDAGDFILVQLMKADPVLHQVAVRVSGLRRDGRAVAVLQRLVRGGDTPPHIRREAATALGRIRDPKSVGALLDAVALENDRMAEHAIIYALIEIGDHKAMEAALGDERPQVRRAALIALDQMGGDAIKPKHVLAMLDPADPAGRETALRILANHPQWAVEFLPALDDALRVAPKDAAGREAMLQQLIAFMKDAQVQDLMAQTLGDRRFPAEVQIVVLEAMGHYTGKTLATRWVEALRKGLTGADERVVRQVLATLRAMPGALQQRDKAKELVADFTGPLDAIAADSKRAEDARVLALAVRLIQDAGLEDEQFELLESAMKAEKPLLLRLLAADALAMASLTDEQSIGVAQLMAHAGPLELGRLMEALEGVPGVGAVLEAIKALEKSPGFKSLSHADLDRVFKSQPEEVRGAAQGLYEKLATLRGQAAERIAQLEGQVGKGDVQRGGEFFYSQKAACSTCHAIKGQGGLIGPDLTKIGAIRSKRDLIEAIVAPSASFARGYEPYLVTLKDGMVHSGVLARETAEALVLITGARQETRVMRTEIARIRPADVSIMPDGLDAQMTPQEIADLVAFLMSLK